jgi:flavorubredoxin
MKDTFKAVEVAKDVFWVGAIDWAVRDFHGYLTSRGTSYNAFLVLAEKITLIDTVKSSFEDEMIARIGSVIDPQRIDYLVSNHAEPDHAGAMGEVIRAIHPEKVFSSQLGAMALAGNFALEGIEKVADGQKLSLGNRDITFVETPMCHWPESMVCYLHDQELLFSQDGFGMHLAGYERFDDEVDERVLLDEAARYYANILMPLGAAVTMTLNRITDMGIAVKIIAPDHGPIWRSEPTKILEKYSRWARQERTTKAVVIYDTMWGSTDRMARAVGEGLASGDVRVRLMPLGGVHRSDIAAEIIDAGALLVGAPTLNSQMFPSIADVMTYLKGLRPKGLVGAVFGSFGWSGEGNEEIGKILEDMRVELVGSPLGVNYSPENQDLQECYRLGKKVAGRLHEIRGKEH